jgi:hypothetical protein
MPYIDLSKLTLPRNETNYNTWADYFELLCLLHEDKTLTVESLKDRILDENDNDLNKAISQINGVAKRVATPPQDLIGEDQVDVDINDPEEDQLLKNAVLQIVGYIRKRKESFGHYYPFDITPNGTISAVDNLSIKNQLYVVLLCSSVIRIINRDGGFAYRITHRFEELCEHPFRMLLPARATILFFGAGGYIEGGDVVEGSFYGKVTQVANRLGLDTTKIFSQEAAGLYNNGDGGLDWMGFHSLGDELSTKPTFFAQCACGNDWEDKMFDAHLDKWRNFIHFLNDYKRYHFIPKSFRNNQNKWLNETSIYNCVLIDRLRLLHLLTQADRENWAAALYADLLTELTEVNISFN